MSTAADPKPAAHRDAVSESTAALIAKHRQRHNDWMVAFIFGAMYWRQSGAGDVAYQMTVEHSRRIVEQLERKTDKVAEEKDAEVVVAPVVAAAAPKKIVRKGVKKVIKRNMLGAVIKKRPPPVSPSQPAQKRVARAPMKIVKKRPTAAPPPKKRVAIKRV